MSPVEKRELCLMQLTASALALVILLKKGDDKGAERVLAERARLKGELRALEICIQVNSN